MKFRTITYRLAQSTLIFLLAYSAIVGVPLRADTIGITYSATGSAPAPGTTPIMTSTTFSFDSSAKGSVTQWNPAVNALWNPVVFTARDVVDLTTATDDASFTLTFANGDTLTGNLVADVSAILASPTGAGTASEVWTFTGGTGGFVGASGVLDVHAITFANSPVFTATGSGTLTAAGVHAPEPANLLLLGTGLLALGWAVRRSRSSIFSRTVS